MAIVYRDDAALSPDAFIELYRSCSLGVRRPLDDPEAIAAMMRHGNLTVTAWDGDLPVGIARTLTDFLYVGYLADLAVRETHQRRGVGLELIRQTQARMGAKALLVLVAAPAARDYYGHIGLCHEANAWTLRAGEELRSPVHG